MHYHILYVYAARYDENMIENRCLNDIICRNMQELALTQALCAEWNGTALDALQHCALFTGPKPHDRKCGSQKPSRRPPLPPSLAALQTVNLRGRDGYIVPCQVLRYSLR